jgi:hypothetical protein
MITSGYINYSRAAQHSHINKRPLMRCNSAPDLKALYNTTYYMSASAANAAGASGAASVSNAASIASIASASSAAALGTKEKNIIPSSKYKSIIFNRYKRNIYLRSKEKYTLGEK